MSLTVTGGRQPWGSLQWWAKDMAESLDAPLFMPSGSTIKLLDGSPLYNIIVIFGRL